MKTLRITEEWLKQRAACRASRRQFLELFPEGVIPTEELALKHSEDFNWAWAITLLLSGEHHAAATKEQNEAIEIRDEATELAHEAFRDPDRGSHGSYQKLVDSIEDAFRVYHIALARIFVRHFLKQGGRELREGEKP